MISNRITQNEDELKEIQNQYLIEMSKICQLSEKEIKFFLTKLKNSDTVSNSYRKVLIDTFVNAVYVYDNEIILIYNVGNKSITINIDLLSDIEKELVTERLGFLKRFGSPKRSKNQNVFLCRRLCSKPTTEIGQNENSLILQVSFFHLLDY